jgi:DNA-binding NarL/FixJ family response regulator
VAPWPWLHGLVGRWRGELLGHREATLEASGRFRRIGAYQAAERTEGVLHRLGGREARTSGAAGSLSPRELEVAQLIAEGLANPAIARRLYLSRPTVASHVAHILTKLDFSSRTQIAAWVATQRARSE